jgi:NAD(P)-dependent dehydrogenase (short-subunit alcohol dehydrogenase family)
MMTFNGEVAVVTGGASGIGFGCSERLAQAGAKVVVADFDTEAGRRAAEKIGGVFIEIDVTDEASIDRCARQAEAEIGPVSMLVTSAGILQPPQDPYALPVELWDRVISTHLRGTYLSCRAFARPMIERRNGRIVTIASVTAILSTPLHAYGPAKAAVVSLTESLATRWGRSGVRVNAISPGITNTPALADAVSRNERNVSAFVEATPLGRLIEPVEIANAALFLLSDAASAITGTNLVVDGGWIGAGTWHTYGGIPDARPAGSALGDRDPVTNVQPGGPR